MILFFNSFLTKKMCKTILNNQEDNLEAQSKVKK